MFTVASARPSVHDQLAEDLTAPPLAGRVVLLLLLALAAAVLVRALRAVLAAAAVLLLPAFALARVLLVVIVLLVAVALSLKGDLPAADDPDRPGPSPTSVRARPVTPRPPVRTHTATPGAVPPLRSMLPPSGAFPLP